MADNNEQLGSIVEFTENIQDAEAPPPLPAGEYVGGIVEAKLQRSQRGTLYAAVQFSVPRDQFPVDYAELLGPTVDEKRITYRRVSMENNPQARYNLRKFCEAIGAPMSNRIDVNEWVGLQGRLGIDHQEYEGVQRENVLKVTAV